MNRLLQAELILGLFQRVKLACKVLVAPRNVVAQAVGQLVTYDPDKRRLVIEGDFEIHATGNLYLNSDQHVVVRSGNDGQDYTHGIHLNPEIEYREAIHVHIGEHRSTSE